MDALFYGFTVFLFAAVIFGIEAVYLWWMGTHGKAAQRITRRLQIMSGEVGRAERISILKQRRYSAHEAVDRVLHQQAIAHRIDQLLVQSGSRYAVEHFLAASAFCFMLGLGLSAQWPLPDGV